MKFEDFDKDNQKIVYLCPNGHLIRNVINKIQNELESLGLKYLTSFGNYIKLENGTEIFFKTSSCPENLRDLRLNKVYVFDKHLIKDYDYIKYNILIPSLMSDNGTLEEI